LPSYPLSRPYSISEEDSADLPFPSTDLDDDDVEKVLDLVPSDLTRKSNWPSSRANESISSINIRDLPALQDDDDDDTAFELPNSRAPNPHSNRKSVSAPTPDSPPTHHQPPELITGSPSPNIKTILATTP
jgi:hypothetical protein